MRAAVAFGVAFSALAAPALPQGIWGRGGLGGGAADSGADVNHGRFVALGGTFGEQRIDCVRCHALDGAGNSSGAFPRLSDQSAWYLYKSLDDYASGARPNAVMGPIARMLSERERRDVAAYYAAVSDAPFLAGRESDLGVIQIGGAIAAIGIAEQGVPACTSCHGADGVGDAPVVPYLAGQFASGTARGLCRHAEAARERRRTS